MWKWVAGFTTIVGVSLLFAPRGAAQQPYPLEPFQCPAGQFTYAFNPVTGGLPGWFCATPGVAKQIVTPPATTVGDLAVWGNTNGTSLIDNGTTFPTITVANNVALKGLPIPVAGTVAYRAGFTTAGDGGDATYTFASANCSISGGDNGLQVQPTTGTGCWNVVSQPSYSAAIWGAVGDGSTNNTMALNAALAAVPVLVVPQGNWVISDELKCKSGNTLVGVGGAAGGWTTPAPATTNFIVTNTGPNAFNMSANGVIQGGTPGTQPGCNLDKFSVTFTQPDTTSTSDKIQYPPAIDLNGVHIGNVAAEGITVMNAWTCLSAQQASSFDPGSSFIGHINCSAYSHGFNIGNNDAFMSIGWFDCETYGLTANQAVAYEGMSAASPGVTGVCGEHLSASGGGAIHIGALTSFRQSFVEDSTPDIGQDNIDTLDLDGNGAFVINNGYNLSIHGGYSSKSSGDTNGTIIGNAGITQVSGFKFADTSSSDIVANSGATVRINHSFYSDSTTSAAPILVASGGLLDLNDMQFSVGGTRTIPEVESTGGILRMTANKFAAAGSGSIVTVTADNAQNYVVGNSINGWSVTLPATILGFYDLPDVPFTITSTPTFTTPGDFSPGTNTVAGNYYVRGSYADFDLTDTFSPTYTTASGTFELALNIPPYAGGINQPCSIAFIQNATNTSPVTAFLSSGNDLLFAQPRSANTSLNWSTTQIPSGATNVQFVVSCRYRIL